MWELIKFLIIGIIQGIGEVLPISSSAHLIIVSELLGMKDDNLALEVFLHLASLIAVLFFLRKKLYKLIKGIGCYLFKKNKEYLMEFKIGCYLIISMIPIVLVALFFKRQINIISNNLIIIGFFLVINGFLLMVIEKIRGQKDLKQMRIGDAFYIGVFQILGLFPGISRSGSCIYGGTFRKLKKEAITEYAFLLFIPTVLGATILELDNFKELIVNDQLWMYLITFGVTCIVTYLAFNILLKIIKKGKLKYFGYYCILLGIITMLVKIIK